MSNIVPRVRASYVVLRRLPLLGLLSVAVLALLPSPVFAQSDATAVAPWQLVSVAVSFLVPVGIALMAIAALAQDRAARAALVALLSAGIAAMAYWGVGFALEFGGAGLTYNLPFLRDLSWEWSLFDVSWGPGWGMAGLRGFFLTQGASTPTALTFFLAQLPWVMTAVILPALVLHNRKKSGLSYVAALLMGAVIYPLFGNWVWGGGWLYHLGQTQSLGHGFVDFGGSSAPFLLAGALAFAVLLLRPALQTSTRQRSRRAPMPLAHYPFMAMAGLFLILAGAAAWLLASPQAAQAGDALPRAFTNGVVACFSGGLVAGFYTWFVSRQADPFMAARGAAAGFVASLAGAPFVPIWASVAVGGLVGLLLPLVVYLTDRVLHLADDCAVVATFFVAGLVGVLWPALWADGLYGVGWNGVAGSGVAGVFASGGAVAGAQGQLFAQLAGIGTILLWGLGLPWAVGRAVQAVAALLVRSSAAPAPSRAGRAGSQSN